MPNIALFYYTQFLVINNRPSFFQMCFNNIEFDFIVITNITYNNY